MMKYLAFCFILCVGCINDNIKIESTKSYEGHFYTKDTALQALNTAKLDKDESIWILSNKTLKRTLKNCK